MENKIYITIVCMLAVDLLSLLFIPFIRSAIKKYNKEVNENFKGIRDMLHNLDKRQSGMHLELVELNVETKSQRQNQNAIRSDIDNHYKDVVKVSAELREQIDIMHTEMNEVKNLLLSFDRITTDMSDTIRKERMDFFHLKDQYKLATSPHYVDILKKQNESLLSKLPKSKAQEVFRDDREANRKLALEIEERNKPKEKKRKKSYHPYNTPERMKELRRLKSLKKGEDVSTPESKNEVEKIKRKVGRPKGRKNNNN